MLAFTARANGEQLFQPCTVCHGEQAQGNELLHAPGLAGQFDWYLSRQLKSFKSLRRGAHQQDRLGQQMAGVAATLDEKNITELSVYIAQLPATAAQLPTTTPAGDLKNGSRYYQAKCGACHGGQAQGNASLNAPKLSAQQVSYLQRQLANFSQGLRGTDPQDPPGLQMAMMAKTVSAKELTDILFYISQQQ